MKFPFFLALATILMTATAKAEILLEPYLSYENGAVSLDYSFAGINGSVGYNMSGIGLGGRAGWTMPLLFFAGDYSMGWDKIKATSVPSGTTIPDNDGTRTSMGIVAGVHLPIIRLWLGYNFLDKLEGKDPSGASSSYTGTGIKLGAGYTGFPMVSINLEYLMTNYNKVKTSNGVESDVGASSTYRKIANNMFLLSVSMPFEL